MITPKEPVSQTEMNILAVDTSTWTGGVALLRGNEIVAAVEVTNKNTHSGRLMSAIDATLGLADMDVRECDGFAVTTGPGSFTGLRIGVSSVKGLAFATQKPVAGISTLEVLAYQFSWFPNLICPMLDARKGEVYTALYKCGQDGELVKAVSERAVEPEQWLVQIKDPCLFAGDGSVLYRGVIEQRLGARVRFAPPYLNGPRASVAAHIGMKRIKRGEVVDVAALAPNYIRKSDAEIKLEAGQLSVS